MNWFERALAAIDPVRARKRAEARMVLKYIDQIESQRRSYDGGSLDRTNASWDAQSESGDAPDQAEIQRLRYRAWDLWRNNPYARRAVRAVISQTIGCGLKPNSMAETPAGEPFEKLRKRSEELWRIWGKSPLAYQRHVGGIDINRLQCDLLREVILSGEVLIRRRHLSPSEVRRKKAIVPYRLEVISADRLDDGYFYASQNVPEGNEVSRGIEFTPEGDVAAYWVLERHPDDIRWGVPVSLESQRIPADKIIHVFDRERVDQTRGVSWLAPVVKHLRDIRDYQDNELMAAAIGACVVMGIMGGAGTSGTIGLNTPTAQTGVDSDSNTVNRLQPGMIFRLPKDATLQGFNPQRPNSSAEGFNTHLLRGTAGGLPGLKASTITGDYRESSFSSERSADNDNWRDVEQCQEWFAASFCKPVWEDVLDAGISSGFLDVDKRIFRDADAMVERKDQITRADWNGPVQKSINPVDDMAAAAAGIKLGVSSLPVEAAAVGLDWRTNLDDIAKVLDYGRSKGLDDNITLGIFGIQPPPPAPVEPASQQKEETPAQTKMAALLAQRNGFHGGN